MTKMFYLSLILIFALARGDNSGREDESGGKAENEAGETIAYGSLGAPVYGAGNTFPYPGLPMNGKSSYNYPVPSASSLPTLPASYAAYITSLGINNPYAYGTYNRYNSLPYTVPSLYGAPLQNSLGYGSVVPGYGYTGYGSPYYGRSAYSGDGYTVPGYLSGLGYRYGGMGYGSAALRASPVARVGVPRGGVPVASVPAPVAAYSGPVQAIPATYPVPYPAVSPYRSAVRPLQSKDGSVRYVYGPDAQALTTY